MCVVKWLSLLSEATSQTLSLIKKYICNTPYRVHRPEGAIFLWLWFENLPITSAELYQRLKNRGVLIV